MLNIPEEIQDLLVCRNDRKNIRIHFPNGERGDIIAQNLVEESVSLTESLCSENNLKFGLCEASCLEFTTIGVPENIKGCVIEVSLEVDISALTEEQIAEFAIYPDDLDYPVYPIPYGVFTIDSCRRQKDMAFRDVVAYSEVYHADSGLSPIEQAKQRFGIKVNTPYAVDVRQFLASNIKNVNMDSIGIDERHPPWSVTLDRHAPYTREDPSGWQFEYRVMSFHLELSTEVTNDDLYRNVYHADFVADKDAFAEYDRIYRGDAGFDVDERYYYPVQVWLETKDKSGYSREIQVPVDGAYVIYPDIGYYQDYVMDIEFTTEVWARYEGDVVYHTKLLEDGYKLTAYTLLGSPTLQFPRKKNGNKYFVDTEINYAGIINAWLELNGMFGRSGRDGKYQFVTLGSLNGLLPAEDLYPADDLYPDDGWDEQAQKSLYYDLWYDEYEIQPFGRVVVIYKNIEGELVEYNYQFDPEYPNTYYIKDNIILQTGGWSEEDVAEIITTMLISNLPDAGYVPLELACKGLPYLDAGDRIEIETGEGCLKTYIMQRTLKGIQALTDEIEVSGDELNTGGN